MHSVVLSADYNTEIREGNPWLPVHSSAKSDSDFIHYHQKKFYPKDDSYPWQVATALSSNMGGGGLSRKGHKEPFYNDTFSARSPEKQHGFTLLKPF